MFLTQWGMEQKLKQVKIYITDISILYKGMSFFHVKLINLHENDPDMIFPIGFWANPFWINTHSQFTDVW